MQVYIGIDWSEKKHDIVFQDEMGRHILKMQIEHSLAGFGEFERTRQRLGVPAEACVVGLETAHNLLVDYLWAQGYVRLYVLPPNQVNSSQGRLRQSGARDDPQDAALITEILRTDRHRLYPWHPGSLLLQQLRAKVAFLGFLSRDIVRHTNRLRSVLLRYYPAAIRPFSSLDTHIGLAFVHAYPTPQAAEHLDFAAFQAFARDQHYPQPKRLPACFARLQQPQPRPAEGSLLAYQAEAVHLAQVLLALVQARQSTQKEVQDLYAQHPDRELYDSLPGAGTYLSAGLLVKFGEDRQRFPHPDLVQSLAGTCPVTIRSGKTKLVRFRKACDQEFRQIAQQWARRTVQESPWAAGYYQHIRPHSRSDSHAYRCLANRWLAIVWKLWHSHSLYDETFHLQQRTKRSLPRS